MIFILVSNYNQNIHSLNFKILFYSAPTNVKIEGDLSLNEGERLNLNCRYVESNPPAKMIRYKIGKTFTQTLGVVSSYTFKYLSIALTSSKKT